MLDAHLARIAKRCQHHVGQPGQVQQPAEPGRLDVQTFSHLVLFASVEQIDGLEIVARAFQICEVLTRTIFDIGETERLLIGQRLNGYEELEIGVIVGVEPCNAPMASDPSNDLVIMIRIVL